MDAKAQNYQIARDYFAAVAAGELPDAMLTPDMTAWITTGGVTMDKAQYQHAIRLLAIMLDGHIKFIIQSLAA